MRAARIMEYPPMKAAMIAANPAMMAAATSGPENWTSNTNRTWHTAPQAARQAHPHTSHP
jgi:hypothetical protein